MIAPTGASNSDADRFHDAMTRILSVKRDDLKRAESKTRKHTAKPKVKGKPKTA